MIGALAVTGSTSRAAQMFDSMEGPNGRDWMVLLPSLVLKSNDRNCWSKASERKCSPRVNACRMASPQTVQDLVTLASKTSETMGQAVALPVEEA